MRLSSYLAKSRHGVFYLRIYVPKSLQSVVGKTEFRRSLNTHDPKIARHLAHVLSPFLRQFRIHMKKQSKNNPFPIDTSLVDEALGTVKRVKYELPDGVLFEAEGNSPEEVANFIALANPALLDGVAAALQPFASSVAEKPAQYPPLKRPPRNNRPYGEFIDAAFLEKSVEYKNARSTQDFRQKALAFSSFIGNMPIAEISSEDFSRFKRKLITEGAAAQTINKYVQGVGIVFAYAIKHRLFVGESPTAKQRAKVDKTPSRAPFQPSHIQAIFAKERLQDIEDPSEFWFPLIGLHTGMRVAEIGQLRLSDLYEQDELHVIDVNETADDASLKTATSRRVIPMPSALIDAGLLDYIADVRSQGFERLFPWLTKTKQGYGANVSKTFSRRLETLGIKTQALTFHSLRHTANKRLADAGVDEAKRAAMLGQDHDTINTKTYHGEVSLPILVRDVAPLLRFDIDYSEIRRPKGSFLAFLKNPPKTRKPRQPRHPSGTFTARKRTYL